MVLDWGSWAVFRVGGPTWLSTVVGGPHLGWVGPRSVFGHGGPVVRVWGGCTRGPCLGWEGPWLTIVVEK